MANSTGAVGKALDISSRRRSRLALVSGARTQFNGDTATLMVENGRSGSLWAQVTGILRSKNYVIAKRDDASQTLNTDWVEWNRLDEDQQYRGRYQISVKPQGYQQAVVVKPGEDHRRVNRLPIRHLCSATARYAERHFGRP